MTHIPKSGRSELCPPQTHVSRHLVDPQPDEGKLDLFSRFKRAVSDHPRVVGSILGLAQLPVFMAAAAGQQATVASLVGADGLRMGRDAESVALAEHVLFGAKTPGETQGSPLFRAIASAVLKATQPGTIAPEQMITYRNWAEPKVLINPEQVFKEAGRQIALAEHEVDIQNFRWSKDSDPVAQIFGGLQKLQARRIAEHATTPVKVRLMIDTMQDGLNDNPKTEDMFIEVRAKAKEYGLDKKFVDLEFAAHDHHLLGAVHSKDIIIDGHTVIITGANLNFFDNWDYTVVRDEPVNNEHDAGFVLHGEIARSAVADFDSGWLSSRVWTAPGGGPLPWPLPHISIEEATRHPKTITHNFPPLVDQGGPDVPMMFVSRPPYDHLPAEDDADHPINRAAVAIFDQAKTEVSFFTANLNAPKILDAIVSATARKVTVKAVLTKGFEDFSEALPGQGGTNAVVVKELYARLAKAGIPAERLQIRWSRALETQKEPDVGGEFRSSHIKALFADRQVALVTSFNLDTQSWGGSREIGVIVDDAKTTDGWLKQLFDVDFKKALPITDPEALGWDLGQLWKTTHFGE